MPLHGEKTWRVTEHSSMLRGGFSIHFVEQKNMKKLKVKIKIIIFVGQESTLYVPFGHKIKIKQTHKDGRT